MIIAVDAMGGDNAPEVVVHGAIQACKELDCKIVLVGDLATIYQCFESCNPGNEMSVYNCSEVIDMGESPIKAYKKKKDSSIRVAFELLKSGQVDAVVSAGNSGATMVAGILHRGPKVWRQH